MQPFNLFGTLSSWSVAQWRTAGLTTLIGACVLSLVPALQKPVQAQLPTQALVINGPTFKRQAIDMKAYNWRTVTVEKGQTLGEVFDDLGIDHEVMRRVLDTPSAKQAFKRVRDGDIIEFEINGYDQLRAMRFDSSDVEQVHLAITDDSIQETLTQRKLEKRLMVASG